ncbi:MAG: cytochrome c maturation protein CcmE [Deltaproteobacteria bacterium]|nr:cytochrome c maturation protein CcmE [Deltaproteobacteria bacterium]
MKSRRTKWIGVIVAIAVILGGLSYLLFGQLESNLVYFVTPGELLAKGALAYERPVRLGGMVKKGTIQRENGTAGVEFVLSDGTQEIAVTSQVAPPQMFQEEMGVVVEGRLSSNQRFTADRIMVKHSNEYHPPKEGEKPAIIYKELLK